MDSTFIGERPLGYQQIAVDAAQALTIPPGTSRILIVAEAQAIRWRDDGTAPTAAIGQPLAVGVEMQYTSRSPTSLRLIAQVAGAIVNATYYGQGVY